MRTRNILAAIGAAAAIAGGAAACGPATSSAPVAPGTSAPPRSAQATAAPPMAGQVLLNFKGHGTEVTPHFTVPGPGNYKVTWSYSGNTDMGVASNFIMEEGPGSDINTLMDLPNDIATSGHGSLEASGDPGSHYFNVTSSGDWTVRVVAVG